MTEVSPESVPFRFRLFYILLGTLFRLFDLGLYGGEEYGNFDLVNGFCVRFRDYESNSKDVESKAMSAFSELRVLPGGKRVPFALRVRVFCDICFIVKLFWTVSWGGDPMGGLGRLEAYLVSGESPHMLCMIKSIITEATEAGLEVDEFVGILRLSPDSGFWSSEAPKFSSPDACANVSDSEDVHRLEEVYPVDFWRDMDVGNSHLAPAHDDMVRGLNVSDVMDLASAKELGGAKVYEACFTAVSRREKRQAKAPDIQRSVRSSLWLVTNVSDSGGAWLDVIGSGFSSSAERRRRRVEFELRHGGLPILTPMRNEVIGDGVDCLGADTNDPGDYSSFSEFLDARFEFRSGRGGVIPGG